MQPLLIRSDLASDPVLHLCSTTVVDPRSPSPITVHVHRAAPIPSLLKIQSVMDRRAHVRDGRGRSICHHGRQICSSIYSDYLPAISLLFLSQYSSFSLQAPTDTILDGTDEGVEPCSPLTPDHPRLRPTLPAAVADPAVKCEYLYNQGSATRINFFLEGEAFMYHVLPLDVFFH
jgi:hypothetical protein